MNKFKKKTRSKMIAASIAILSSAAVVSTGFATWVISGGSEQKATGTITADTVTESYHTIDFTSANTATINFGAPAKDDSVKDPWLTNDAMGGEKLLATFEFTVANVKTGEDAYDKLFSSITFNAKDDTNKYKNASDAKLVSVMPSWTKTAYDDEAPTYDSKTATDGSAAGIYLLKGSSTATSEGVTSLAFKLYIQFTWGNEFGFKNPFYFYNAGGKTASTDGVKAKTNLDKVADIKDVSFALTIKTK